jgi:hypothetical protein
MHWDFTNVVETEDFASLPQGWYTVTLQEVREGRTREGDVRWGLKLGVHDGVYAGRVAAWDSLVWSERGAPRAKRLLDALGFNASGSVDIVPADLIHCKLDVELVMEEWENPTTGRRQRRNVVPYDGFAPEGQAGDRRRAEQDSPLAVE